MTFDVVISQTVEAFLSALTQAEREECYQIILDVLCVDPYPDNISKVYLPVPYKPGTIGFAFGEFWFSYTILNAGYIAVAAIYWNPSSPRHPMNRGR